jgi:uncharacterized OB-fold protein
MIYKKYIYSDYNKINYKNRTIKTCLKIGMDVRRRWRERKEEKESIKGRRRRREKESESKRREASI